MIHRGPLLASAALTAFLLVLLAELLGRVVGPALSAVEPDAGVADADVTAAPSPAAPTAALLGPTAAPSALPAPPAAPTPLAPPPPPLATSAPAPTAASTAPALPERVQIANTDGSGAYVRAAPSGAAPGVARPEGTVLDVVGPDAVGDGGTWRHVRDPWGVVGWTAAAYLSPAVELAATPGEVEAAGTVGPLAEAPGAAPRSAP